MVVECATCGAPLDVPDDARRITCQYCKTRQRPSRDRASRGPARGAQPDEAQRRRILMLTLGSSLLVTGMAAVFVFLGARASDAPEAEPAPAIEVEANLAPLGTLAADALEGEASALAAASEADPTQAAGDEAPPRIDDGFERRAKATTTAEPEPEPKPARKASKVSKAAKASETDEPARATAPTTPAPPTTPIVSKQEAQSLLEPQLLACMKQHGTYDLIVRVGQGYGVSDKGPLPPLRIVDTSVVDYEDAPKLASTPLGACIGKAIGALRANTFKGNYMYFGLTNEDAPDPLNGAPNEMDRKEADAALIALDEEARDCQKRFPDDAPQGTSIGIDVEFRGVTGAPQRVYAIYLDKGPYATCLADVYRKARVKPFRRLKERVVHRLMP